MTLSADRVTDLNSCVAHTSSETEYFCHPGTFFLSLLSPSGPQRLLVSDFCQESVLVVPVVKIHIN